VRGGCAVDCAVDGVEDVAGDSRRFARLIWLLTVRRSTKLFTLISMLCFLFRTLPKFLNFSDKFSDPIPEPFNRRTQGTHNHMMGVPGGPIGRRAAR
jgi:hypothetical protein